jgi:hypothetical protein
MVVDLTNAEWNQLMTIIGNTRDFPWSATNPLLMKIGQQLQLQQLAGKHTNSEEVPINIGENAVKQ